MRAIAWLISGAFALFATVAYAQAPANATAQCKDDTYTTTTSHRGACKGHGGVKEWYDKTGTSSPSARGETSTGTTEAPSHARANTGSAGVAPGPQTVTAAAGGGAGKVWVNSRTKVYHCEGDEWYGKTKHGEYLPEADARAKGYHAAHGKACS